MFSISGDTASSSFPLLRESFSLFGRIKSFCPSFLAARLTISCRYNWELPTSAFEMGLPQFPVAKLTLFLLFSFSGLPGDCDPCDETPSLHWPCNTTLVSQAFAIGDPSLEVVYCSRFDVAPKTVRFPSLEREDVKWLPEYVENHMMFNKHRKRFHSFLEKLPLVWIVSKLVVGVNIFDLDFGVQVDPFKQPIKCDSVTSRHMSHRGTSSFDYHFDHGFVVFKNVQMRFILRRTCDQLKAKKDSVVQIVFHTVFFRLPRGLGHFADSNSIR